jgi:hypothetical protein
MYMESNSQSDLIAVENHIGRGWGVVILLAVIGPAISVAIYHGAPAMFALTLVGVIGLGVFAMAWSGFQYRFTQDGLEIRMLGFRLRSIPRSEIVNYAIEPWSFIRGYGIRGIGRARAYVWYNKVVHIKLSNGNEVYLGHNDPDRIVRDLDQMMAVVARG